MLFRLFVVLLLAALILAHRGTSKEKWEDTAMTTNLWAAISNGDEETVEAILESDPTAANVRSGDGRGPLWWAYEYKQETIVELLLQHGALPNERDGDGKRPSDVGEIGPTKFAPQREYSSKSPASDYHGEELEDEFE